MKLMKRTGPHFGEAAGGMVPIAAHVAGQPPQFPPIEFVHNDQQVEDIDLGPTGSLYSFTVVHPEAVPLSIEGSQNPIRDIISLS